MIQANPPARRGTVLIVALVCLLIGMTLVCALLQGTLRARRQLRVERDRRQTDLLLQAGLDRAALLLAKETDYRGESWDIPAASLSGNSAALVTIKVSREADDRPWQIHVVAEYPAGSELSIRRSRTVVLENTEQPQE